MAGNLITWIELAAETLAKYWPVGEKVTFVITKL